MYRSVFYLFICERFSDLQKAEEMVKRYKSVAKEVPELRLVHQWLVSRNALTNVSTPELPSNSQCFLCEIIYYVDNFKAVIGMEEDVLTLLKFFLQKKSILFDSMSRQFIGITNKVFLTLI